MMPLESNILTIKGISVRFGGLQALNNIDIQVDRNTVHGIIDPKQAPHVRKGRVNQI